MSLPGKAATWATVPWQRLPVPASSLARNDSEWNLDCNLKKRLEDFGDSPLRYINRRRITFPSQTLMGNHQDLQNQLERPRLEAGAGVTARQSRHVGDSPLAETPSPSLEFGQKLFGMELELQFAESKTHSRNGSDCHTTCDTRRQPRKCAPSRIRRPKKIKGVVSEPDP